MSGVRVSPAAPIIRLRLLILLQFFIKDRIGGSDLHIFGFLCWCVDMVLASCKDGHVGDCIGMG